MTESINTSRLTLTPLDVADAAEMVDVLSDPALYAFTGGTPPNFAQLLELYRHQTSGAPRGGDIWHNWILRLDGSAIGYVQATVKGVCADLAWFVGVPWQGSGYATESSQAVRDWLADRGVARFSAQIHPDNGASRAVATRLGLRPTGQSDADGEMIWE